MSLVAYFYCVYVTMHFGFGLLYRLQASCLFFRWQRGSPRSNPKGGVQVPETLKTLNRRLSYDNISTNQNTNASRIFLCFADDARTLLRFES